MADSITIALDKNIWTDISSAAANGLITNESQYMQLVKEAAVLPNAGDLTGHSNPSGKSYNWAGVSGNIYARALPNQISPGTDCEVTTQA